MSPGARKWHFQLAHHPLWNYDISSAPILADITIDGKAINLERCKAGPMFTSPSLGDVKGTLGSIAIGNGLGGTNWPGGAYDPETHIAYMPTNNTFGR